MKKEILSMHCVAHLDVANNLHHEVLMTCPVIKNFIKIREEPTLTVYKQ